MTYTTQGAIGIDFDGGTETTPSQPPGSRMVGTDASTWLYIEAGAAIAQYDVVAVTELYYSSSSNYEWGICVGSVDWNLHDQCFGKCCRKRDLVFHGNSRKS